MKCERLPEILPLAPYKNRIISLCSALAADISRGIGVIWLEGSWRWGADSGMGKRVILFVTVCFCVEIFFGVDGVKFL